MADSKKKEKEPQAPKVIWDDSDMRSLYSNVTNVTGGREEIVLLFGMNQAWHADQKEVKIELGERVVMSPFAAKRLAILLNRTLGEYEKRFGELNISGTPEAK